MVPLNVQTLVSDEEVGAVLRHENRYKAPLWRRRLAWEREDHRSARSRLTRFLPRFTATYARIWLEGCGGEMDAGALRSLLSRMTAGCRIAGTVRRWDGCESSVRGTQAILRHRGPLHRSS